MTEDQLSEMEKKLLDGIQMINKERGKRDLLQKLIAAGVDLDATMLASLGIKKPEVTVVSPVSKSIDSTSGKHHKESVNPMDEVPDDISQHNSEQDSSDKGQMQQPVEPSSFVELPPIQETTPENELHSDPSNTVKATV